MTFLVPFAGWLTILAVPIILLYILKVRLRRQPVSTTMFWQQVFDERKNRSLWRRLRRLLSLSINLLFLLLLVVAVMNPVLPSQFHSAQTVVVLDNSLSMNAIEPNGTSRFETAKSEIRRFLSSIRHGHRAALLTAGSEPRVVVGFTEHLETLRGKLDAIEPGSGAVRLADTVELARKISPGDASIQILVYTDGCSADVEPLQKDADVRFFPIGRRLENTAITKFQPRRSFGDPLGYEILVEVVHFGSQTVECRLEVDLDDTPVDVVPLTLEPNAPQTLIVQGLAEKGGTLHGRLTVHDALSADDTASAPLAERSVQTILFYGDTDFFLGNVLQSQPNVALNAVDELPEALSTNSVLVVHRAVPDKLPTGNILVIDPQNGNNLLRVGENSAVPIVGRQEKEQPLLRFVQLTNVLFPGAKTLLPSEVDSEKYQFTSLLETPEGDPLYAQITTPDRRVLALSTELSRGELALRTAFPLMIANALTLFRNDGGELQSATPLGNLTESDLSSVADDFYRLRTDSFHQGTVSRPLWFWAALAAMFLSATEWWAFQRRRLD